MALVGLGEELHIIAKYLNILDYHELRFSFRNSINSFATLYWPGYQETLNLYRSAYPFYDLSQNMQLAPSDHCNASLRGVIRGKHFEQLKRMIDNPKLTHKALVDCLCGMIMNKTYHEYCPKIVLLLLQKTNPADEFPSYANVLQNLLQMACALNYPPAVRWVLDHPLFDTDYNYGPALGDGGKYDSCEAIAMMLDDPRINSRIQQSLMLRQIGTFNGYRTLKYLLETRRLKIDPMQENQEGFTKAAQFGHLELVKLYLRHPRTRTWHSDDIAFRLSCEEGHMDVAQYLYDSGKVQPNAYKNAAAQGAMANGHVIMIDWLRKLPRVNIWAEDLKGFKRALDNNQLEMVEWCARQPEFDPNYDDGFFFKFCAKKKFQKLFHVLARHPRADQDLVDFHWFGSSEYLY
ncbi:hypothetical protein HK103_003390 [Boothiomyces macroporosus]|uniref:Ankyrin repeat protein n=1 Tax=Boothiomyces macroporosus TaxID=261099 RepID=A0AAD5U8R9_9FUNG|nr:hypothetical protein HK103_003390 [Boothiomyces macroporosus]